MTSEAETMVERIATIVELAIVRHGVPMADLEGTLDDAKAVLTALLDPTEEMVEAGYARLDWGPPGYDDAPDGPANPKACFRVMIQGALQPGSKDKDSERG